MQELVTFTNMCMVYDQQGNVLVQNRVDPGWSGITFPGGHVEAGESFSDAVIREVFEETGLTIEAPRLCGIKQWYEKEKNFRYVVLCYKTCRFQGCLASSEEGGVSWVPLEELGAMKLASGMELMLRLFLEDNVSEHCFFQENGQWGQVLK